jgi:hypothetical protein
MAFTFITVTDHYELASGVPAPSDPSLSASRRSRIRFTPSAPMINDGVVVQAPVTALLDATGGLFVVLAANTDPTTVPNPTDGDAFASYYVEEFVETAVVARYYVQIPHDAVGGTVVLSSLNRAVLPPVVTYPAPGPTGPQGDPGPGVPTGGATGAALVKSSSSDYATTWQAVTALATALTIASRDAAGAVEVGTPMTNGHATTKQYVDGAIAAIVASAPGVLDTLNELAAALGNDPAFATTMANALAQRLRVDVAQSLTGTQQSQGRSNLALGGAAVLNVGTAAGTVAAGDDSRITGAVPSTRQVIAGTGLTGGGTLAADRTLTVSYGTAAGTAAQGNDSRITGAVQNTRQVISGTGLTGGGDLTADRTLAVAYGTTSTTAAVGNDSRITGAAQKASNLSDLASASTARTNLGLVAVAASGSASDLSTGTLSNARLPRVLSPVTALTGQTGAISTDAATAGNFIDWTCTGNVTLNAPTNPSNHQILHIAALASGATRTVTLGSGVQNASGATFPLSVPSGKVGRIALEYVGLLSAWVVTAAVVTP